MAKIPVPAKPSLFKDFKGRYTVHYPSTRSNGGRTLGSHHLHTKNPAEAKQLMAAWLASGELEKMQKAAKDRVGQPKEKPTTKLKPKPRRKKVQASHINGFGQEDMNQLLGLLTTQLHALAVTTQMLTTRLGAPTDED